MAQSGTSRSLASGLWALAANPASLLSTDAASDSAGAAAPTQGFRERFRLLRAHAEGSLGFVSVARDEQLRRDVAIKEMKPQFADDTQSFQRFVLEAEVTQSLDHPGVAPVYEIGRREDGRPYYAMRFVEGQSLKEAIRAFHGGDAPRALRHHDFTSLEFRKLLQRLIDVCHTIQFAHQRGVLHRDLKPGNIMLGAHGETTVVDWGMAKIAGRAELRDAGGEEVRDANWLPSDETTMAGAVLGTPAYMSPEQAAGHSDDLGPATDIYGLGATLYHMLTGHAPLSKQPLPILLARVQEGKYPPPREVNRAIPRPLAAICGKAMALRPEGRYTSAEALAADLEQWLADEPIEAYDEGQWVKSARWVRHHMAEYTLGMIIVLATLIIPLVTRCQQLEMRNRKMQEEVELLRSTLPTVSPPVVTTVSNPAAAQATNQLTWIKTPTP